MASGCGTTAGPHSGTADMGRRLWSVLTIPGVAWLSVFFLFAFYAVASVGLGNVTELYQPVPHWNPLDWNVGYLLQAIDDVVPGGRSWDVFIRTLSYVAAALLISLAIGYPVAYYTSRHAGRRRGLILVLLVLPFWISYLMRMLAWTNPLDSNGDAPKLLVWLAIGGLMRELGLLDGTNWLGGQHATVIMALVYG